MDGPEEPVEDKDIAAALQSRARRIHLQSALAGVVYGVVAWLLT